ncbi:vasculin-like protein 1 isoform X2 [Aplysia californica]|uniref:Vasculin-like protein 1 isoform X2 n=1 Tax=Aplysia californica TaxID=6500 RepID=A0ABM0KAD5_APLCA|nr:vasculin-like protein 1 isoform X2 [Aplysia californica]
MAESNEPKQDFAPPWLKFPPADSSSSSVKSVSYPAERNRQRRDDPYSARPEFSRLHRQSSFDFHEGKRFHQGQSKYRHHSVDDDSYNSPYNYGYYPPGYNYEKYGMQYSSQPSLGRSISRDGKLIPPRPSQGTPRRGGYHEKDHPKDPRNYDGKFRERGSERDRPFSDDFPSLVSNGEPNGEVKPAKPGSGVWENPPKSNRNDDSPDLLKNTSPGIYKALVPNKNGPSKKPARDGLRMNGNVRDSSPLSPSNKSNYKEGTRQSPTPDLTIVTQPKKLGDKKSEFLRALRNESSLRNGDNFQDQNQNAIGKREHSLHGNESPMMEDVNAFTHVNGNHGSDVVNGKESPSCEKEEPAVNGDGGETLVSDVDHINLEGEEEEKRLLLEMGWDEEDDTEYVITDDEIREFQDLLQNHCHGQKNGLKSSLRNVLSKNFANGLNGSNDESEKQSKPL